MADLSFRHRSMISFLNPSFLLMTVTGPRKWCFFIQFCSNFESITRAMAIIGRAIERICVATSQQPWCPETSRIGVSGVSSSIFTTAGVASAKSRCSR